MNGITLLPSRMLIRLLRREKSSSFLSQIICLVISSLLSSSFISYRSSRCILWVTFSCSIPLFSICHSPLWFMRCGNGRILSSLHLYTSINSSNLFSSLSSLWAIVAASSNEIFWEDASAVVSTNTMSLMPFALPLSRKEASSPTVWW